MDFASDRRKVQLSDDGFRMSIVYFFNYFF